MARPHVGMPIPKVEYCYLRLSECSDRQQFTEVLTELRNTGWSIASEFCFELCGKVEIVVRLVKEVYDDGNK